MFVSVRVCVCVSCSSSQRTLSHRNLVGDISIRGMWRYRLAMNNAIQRLLYRNFSPAQTAEYLDTQFRQIYAEEAGNNASSVAEAYRKFLHYVPPPPPAPPPPRSNVTAPPPPPPEAPAVPVSAGKRSFAWQVRVNTGMYVSRRLLRLAPYPVLSRRKLRLRMSF